MRERMNSMFAFRAPPRAVRRTSSWPTFTSSSVGGDPRAAASVSKRQPRAHTAPPGGQSSPFIVPVVTASLSVQSQTPVRPPVTQTRLVCHAVAVKEPPAALRAERPDARPTRGASAASAHRTPARRRSQVSRPLCDVCVCVMRDAREGGSHQSVSFHRTWAAAFPLRGTHSLVGPRINPPTAPKTSSAGSWTRLTSRSTKRSRPCGAASEPIARTVNTR